MPQHPQSSRLAPRRMVIEAARNVARPTLRCAPGETARRVDGGSRRGARVPLDDSEVDGRVLGTSEGRLRVELPGGIPGAVRYRSIFARPSDLRDFLQAHPPGSSLRVRIRRIAGDEANECELLLADAVARRWVYRSRPPALGLGI